MVAYWKVEFLLVSLVFLLSVTTHAQYVVPDPQFEVLEKGGFRVSIPAVEETKRFRFNGNINKEIIRTKPGEITGETSTKQNGVFYLEFENKLNVGDVIYYRIDVYNGFVGYRKEDLTWTVKRADFKDGFSPLGPMCRPSSTTTNGRTSCVGSSIILDEFNDASIDTDKWIIEHMIPTYHGTTNFEFNSYENRNETRFIKGGVLYLKPIPLLSVPEVRGVLDLRNGCTADDSSQCYYNQTYGFILPPVKSARITSKISFKYGKIDIRAKLPTGDWLYPIIELQMKDKILGPDSPTVVIAYSRGNDKLTYGNHDIGSRLLYAGPVLTYNEPYRSKNLKQLSAFDGIPYNNDFHTYTLEWVPGKMSFYIDSNLYGEVPTVQGFDEFQRISTVPEAPFDREYVISLGVGAGGVIHFPDGYDSGSARKPWSNIERNTVRSFFDARNVWSSTWKGDNAALQIEYVKVTAI